MSDERRDWQDRLLDQALRELHGAPPPDLSARVLDALDAEHGAARTAASGPAPRLVRRRGLPLWLLGVAAAAGIVVGLIATQWRGVAIPALPAREMTPPLTLAAVRGEVACVRFVDRAPETTWLEAGSQIGWPARAGNRLRSAAGCDLLVAPFGSFTLAQTTELEVRSMEFSLKNGVVAASSLTIAVVAGVVTWHALTRSETANAGEVMRLPAQTQMPEPTLLAENERLRQRIADLEQQALQTQAARTAAPLIGPAAAEPQPVVAPVEIAVGGVAFDDPRYAEALAAVDWQLVGKTTRDLSPLLADLMKRLAAGEEMPLDVMAKIQALNANLVGQLPELMKAKLPGFGPNGTFTHPLVIANSLASTLAASGLPLNDAQRGAIDGLVKMFASENEALAGQSRDFDIEQLAAEAEMKDRYYHELSSRLSPEQFAAMYPEGASNFAGGSLFNSSLMTQPYAEPVPSKDGADFARIAAGKLREYVGLDDAKVAQAQAVIERYAANAPELWQGSGSGPRPAGTVLMALRMQVQFLQEIKRTVGLTPEQLAKLKNMRRFLMPTP